jgi:iron complex outermembrane receptor protein
MKIINLCSVFLLVFLAGTIVAPTNKVLAQTEVAAQTTFGQETLEMIVVSATRMASKIMEIPAHITVVTGDDVRDTGYSNTFEALKNESGMTYDPVNETVQFRGMSMDYVQVIVDGTPTMIQFNNDSNLETIPFLNLDRMEIMRGASSTSFGGNAVTGVINVTTTDPETNELTFKVGYGTYDTWYKGFDAHLRHEKLGIGLGYEGKQTGGYVQRLSRAVSPSANANSTNIGTGYLALPTAAGGTQYFVGERGRRENHRDNAWFSVKYDFTPTLSAKYKMNYYLYLQSTEDPKSFVHDAAGNPLFAGSTQIEDGRWLNFTNYTFTDYINRKETLSHALNITEDKYDIIANLGLVHVIDQGYSSPPSANPFAATPGNTGKYPGYTYFVDFQKEWNQLPGNRILTGFSFRQDEMQYYNYRLSDWHDVSSVTSTNYESFGSTRKLAVFVQDEISFLNYFKIFAGVRYDHFTNFGGNSTYYTMDPVFRFDYPRHTYSQLSPKVALEFNYNDIFTLYGSFGRSFNPPQLYQLFRASTIDDSIDRQTMGNPYLRPEKADTFEIGAKADIFDINVSLTFFYIKTRDFIELYTFDPGDFPIFVIPDYSVYAYTNIESSKRRGFEISVDRQFGDHFAAYANYTWQKATNETNNAGTPLTTMPKHIFNAGAQLQYGAFDLRVNGNYVSKRGAATIPNHTYGLSGHYEPRFLLDATANLTLFDHYKLTLSGTNLLDKDYIASGYYTPGRALTLYLTAKY